MSQAAERGLAAAAVVLLSAVAFLLVRDHAKDDAPTMDEPFHALAGAEYVLSGTYFANLEHPPLAKILAGTSMAAAGVRAPRIPRPFSGSTAEVPQHFVFFNEVPWQRLMAAARAPFPWLLAGLVVLTAAIAWRLAGPVAGAGAAALVALEPGHLAHAAFVHTDVLCSLGFLAAASLALVARRRGPLAWIPVGLALGLTMAGKFTGVLLVPVLAGIAAAEALRRRKERAPRPFAPLVGLALAGTAAAAALLAPYAFAMRRMTLADAEHAQRVFLEQRNVPSAQVARTLAVTRLLPPAGHYLAGLAGVAAQNRAGGGVNVLMGKRSVQGFPAYFPVAFAVKSALATLAALLAALLLFIARPAARCGTAAILLAGPALVFLAGASSSYNIGVRHVLPVYPAIAVVAAVVLVRGFPRARAAALLSLLALLGGLEVARVHPHEIAFFNALAGGPAHGARWLNDSNLDWGQDLVRLSRALERGGAARETTIAYFGGGLPDVICPGARVFVPGETPVTPGLWAVSQYLLAAGPELLALRGHPARAEGYAALRRELLARGVPAGRVGYSILVFRLPPGEPHRR